MFLHHHHIGIPITVTERARAAAKETPGGGGGGGDGEEEGDSRCPAAQTLTMLLFITYCSLFVKRDFSLQHFTNGYPSMFFVWGRKMILAPTFYELSPFGVFCGRGTRFLWRRNTFFVEEELVKVRTAGLLL